MVEAIVAVAVAVAGQIMFYFIQKALDEWWKSHFPPSSGNSVPQIYYFIIIGLALEGPSSTTPALVAGDFFLYIENIVVNINLIVAY